MTPDCLENELLPSYYESPADWWRIFRAGMTDICPRFDAERLAAEYYERLYGE